MAAAHNNYVQQLLTKASEATDSIIQLKYLELIDKAENCLNDSEQRKFARKVLASDHSFELKMAALGDSCDNLIEPLSKYKCCL